jgi:hypothetical protein
MSSVPWEIIDGVPTYKLFIDGQWVQSSRNAVVDNFNPSAGKLYDRAQGCRYRPRGKGRELRHFFHQGKVCLANPKIIVERRCMTNSAQRSPGRPRHARSATRTKRIR